MSTENRCSSNHGTRTFTLDSLTAALEQVQALHEISADLIAENVFGQPAQQGRGEPIMLAAVGELQEDGDGGLEVQWLLEGGTSELLHGMTLLVAENAPDLCREDGSAQVYTHADPAEVERLRDEAHQDGLLRVRYGKQIDELRTQLAEAHALLEEAYQHDIGTPLKRKMRDLHDALSASAEPSAPVEIDEPVCKGAWELGTACGKCSRCKAGAALEPVKLALIQRLRSVGTNQLHHITNGSCPDQIEGYDSRDESCPACKVLMQADAFIGKQ